MTEEQSSINRKEFDSSQEQLVSDSNITSTAPPVFSGFEIFKADSDGFFIINLTDGSIFKWIDTNALKCNGKFDDQKGFFKNGRRNFEGYIWNFFKESNNGRPGYVESDDISFRTATQMFGGFYISAYRARMDKEGNLFFADRGPTVDCINFAVANNNAKLYAATFAVNEEFISAIPCGAAMDCVSEEIYERFEKEVLEVKNPRESWYDAWNRHEKTCRPQLRSEGVYGLHDLIYPGAEITSEAYNDIGSCCAVRAGARGLFLITYYDWEKELMDCYFEIGHRNFISTEVEFYNYGYRIVLLPQKI